MPASAVCCCRRTRRRPWRSCRVCRCRWGRSGSSCGTLPVGLRQQCRLSCRLSWRRFWRGCGRRWSTYRLLRTKFQALRQLTHHSAGVCSRTMGSGRYKCEVTLSKTDLNQIEEIPTQQVPPDIARSESDVEVKNAKIIVHKPHWMNRRRNVAPNGGVVGKALTGKDVDTQSCPYLPVKQRSLGT